MQEVFLNLLPNGVPPVCYISQYDGTSRVIRFHLLNGTEPLTLNGSETITLNFRKPNREEVTLAIENTSSNYIDLVISSELSDKHGEGFGEFRIQGLGTLSFKMYIESDAYGDALKTRSVSGPIATFETDLAENLIKLDVDLEPVQDLHGYDYPWPAGGGKNLFDIDNAKQYSNWSSTVATSGDMPSSSANKIYTIGKLQAGKTYTISFGFISGSFPIFLYFGYYDENGVATRLEYITTDNIASTSYTFVAIADMYYCLRMGQTIQESNFNTQVSKIQTIQLEINSSATAWNPYSNICPITGHDSAQLFRVGKNVWDEEWEIGTISPNTGANVVNPNKIRSKNLIPVSPDTPYRFVALSTTNDSDFIYFYDENGNYLSYITYTHTTIVSYVFATPANCKYIRFILKGTTYNHDISINYPATFTDYEPYESDPTPITVNFGQTVYKGILYSEQRKALVTHVLFEKAVADMNNSEDFPGWQRFGIRDLVGSGVSGTFSTIGNVGSSYSINTMGVNDILFLRKDLYKMTQSEWIVKNPDLVAQFVIELADPFYIDLSQEQTEDVEKTAIASFETNIQRPLETSEHYFSCSQAEGTPTPESPIPINGVSEITAYRTGKNLTNIAELPYTVHWGTDAPELVSFLNTLPIGVYTISNKYKINGLPGNNKVQHGRFYITALIDGSQTPVLSYSVVTDTSPTVGKIYEESGTFEITASNKGKFNHAYRYCDQDTTHTGNDRGSYTCYDIQLEKASSATPYEPYSGESITVSLGGTYYGGKLVQNEDGSRKLVITHGLISKAIADMNNSDTYPGWRNSGIKDMVGAGIDGSETGILNIGTNYAFNTKGTNDIVYLPRGNYNNLTQPQWIENYPDLVVQIRVPLAEPIEIDLPDGDPLTALAGENNVYCNTGDTALTYYFSMVADPIRIPALVGTNNVYSDAGDVDVKYYTTLEGGND